MSEQHLKVIQGGQARTPGSNQENPVSRQPAGVLGLQLHATLAQAYTPLKAKVDALGTDWDTRPASFWQEILTALPVLREAVQPCIKYTEGDRQNFPCCFSLAFIAIRYSLLSALHRAESLIDDTGIAVTSYKSVCLSSEVRHLPSPIRLGNAAQARRGGKHCTKALGVAIAEQCWKQGQ